MARNRNFMIIRYLLMAGTAFNMMVTDVPITSPGIIFFFILVILVQLRMFMVNDRRVWNLLVFLEILAMIPIIIDIKASAFPLAGLLAMEAGLLEGRFLSEGYMTAFLILQISLLPFHETTAMYLGFSVLIYLVFRFLRQEFIKKQEAQQLYDQLRMSESKLQKAYQDLEMYAESIEEITKLRERNRISREIHDSVGHDLSTMIIQLGALEKITLQDDTLNPMIRQLKAFLKESLEHVRMAVQDLKPDEYKNFDSIVLYENLLNQYQKLTGREVVYSFSKNRWRLNNEQYTALYRVIQEFLGNSSKHSEATRISCTILFTEMELSLLLQDNGGGTEHLVKGFGLHSMEERILELGGTMAIETGLGQGFIVKISLPRIQKLKEPGRKQE